MKNWFDNYEAKVEGKSKCNRSEGEKDASKSMRRVRKEERRKRIRIRIRIRLVEEVQRMNRYIKWSSEPNKGKERRRKTPTQIKAKQTKKCTFLRQQ